MKLLTWLTVGLMACSNNGSEPPTQEEPPVTPPVTSVALRLEVVASGLNNPVYLTSPRGDARLFVVEQPGRIRIVSNGSLLPTPFLDITSKVGSGGERGLLSVAFDPAYATSGLFFVNYTDLQGHTRIERYRVGSNANVADAASARLVLMIEQPFANHNGGHVLFGLDGMLYIPMGDGGSAGDPGNRAQDRSNMLGDLLRLDVSQEPYRIPANNPYVGQSSVRNEIWAYGLRNPWRIWFDRTDNLLYIADVGQGQQEEVNVVPAATGGQNYGWRLMEGNSCFNPTNCDRTGLTLPVLTYSHNDGCSITGGIVYRGSRIPALRGHYFYSDYCEGWVRSFRYVNGSATEQRTWQVGSPRSITSYGEDSAGEMYLMSGNGTVYRFVAN
jgi:glucose/arabinose dehydrogenase